MKKITGFLLAIAAFTLSASAQDSTSKRTKKPMKTNKTWQQKDSSNWDNSKMKDKKSPAKKPRMRKDTTSMYNRDSM